MGRAHNTIPWTIGPSRLPRCHAQIAVQLGLTACPGVKATDSARHCAFPWLGLPLHDCSATCVGRTARLTRRLRQDSGRLHGQTKRSVPRKPRGDGRDQ